MFGHFSRDLKKFIQEEKNTSLKVNNFLVGDRLAFKISHFNF